jgi:GAF domain-containing protein
VPPGPLGEVPVGSGIVGGLGEGEPEVVNEPAADPRASTDERALGAIVVAPLRAKGRAIGVIGAASAEPHEYRAADLKVLAAIAALTGPAIEAALAREAESDAGVG